MRWSKIGLAVLVLSTLVGCAQTRILTITTDPPDATIKVDGAYHGQGSVTVPLTFESKTDVHVIVASRLGYKDEPVQLTLDNYKDPLRIELQPLTRRVTFNIVPVPAMVKIDGKLVTETPTKTVSRELEFTVDDKNNWNSHSVVVESPGFATLKREISWIDPQSTYTLRLEPQNKDLEITSEPSGASVSIDGEEVGVTPLTVTKQQFPVDRATGEPATKTLVINKSGFDPVTRTIGWDDGQSQYHIDLAARSKSVRIVTSPPGAKVVLDGRELQRDAKGVSIASDLEFPPIDEEGNLIKYKGEATHSAGDREWEPKAFEIGWDRGQGEYRIALEEIVTRVVPLISVKIERAEDNAWIARPDASATIAMKGTAERADQPEPKRLTDNRGIIDSFALAPDGEKIIFAVLEGRDAANFRSQLYVINTAGEGRPQQFSDGKSLEITPTYTAAGDQIFFSSNRAGRNLQIWSMDATGLPGATRHTAGNSFDLWPDIDADPKPRLYYQSYVETRDDPRLYSMQLHTIAVTDLTAIGGMQPRVSPTFDRVLFTVRNETTGNRDIYVVPSTGGAPTNLTDTPDVDEHSPAWSSDASRVAFASNQATLDGRRHYDIWTMDVDTPQQQTQITTNGSWDDNPVWDPNGAAIYFRSNRGGEWAIWRLEIQE